MLYWCGFSILWKLDVALLVGLIICLTYQQKSIFTVNYALYWFVSYMALLLVISSLGSFGGYGVLSFPMDIACIFPFSVLMLYLSQALLNYTQDERILCDSDELMNVSS